jgi:hypothetical protein
MSAYIIPADQMNRIASFLAYGCIGQHHRAVEIAEDHFGQSSNLPSRFNLSDDSEVKRLAECLYWLNRAAVSQRYSCPELAKPALEYRAWLEDGPITETPVQAYKSLRCLIYQCSEGDIPETPLYKALVNYAAAIAAYIVCSTPEYDEAAWG